jgi:DNA-binding winged helix-turn-helix (wHTH) protein
LYFLLHSGRLISHEELFDAVWEGRIVDDSALRIAINSLRNVLQDESKSPHYIATVSKRGYRFMADVSVKDHYLFAKTNLSNSLCYQSKAELFPAWFEYTNELTELQEAFQQVSNGQRRLVFLNGEQGIGKTALLDIFLANVNSSELSVLRARCVQMKGVTEPFLPLLEALERRCREPYGCLLIEQLNNLAPTWLYQMLNVLNPEECAMLQTKISSGHTGCILREGAHFFETLSSRSTLILVLDNSHWSDEFTLDLLNFLMFRCSAAKLLIIVSYRPCGDSSGLRRIDEMRAELFHRGLCQELSMQKRRN